MPTVTVYQFRRYDISTDQMQLSRRMATRKAIETIARGEIVEGSALEIDAGEIGGEVEGMTRICYQPSSFGPNGFQTVVR